MSEKYNPRAIESKWQSYWRNNGTFKSELDTKEKYYILEMFPYLRKIHMGHVRIILCDVIARLKEQKVLMSCILWGGMLLVSAENAAIENNISPGNGYENIDTMDR